MSQLARGALIVAVWTVCAGPTARAATLRVPAEHATIKVAINAALPGDTVLVAPGCYTGLDVIEISFQGKDIVLRSERGPEQTILVAGEAWGSCVSFRNGETAAAVLEGFTLTNGISIWDGAGVFCEGASPTIADCVFAGNKADGEIGGRGGAIVCGGSASPTIVGCTVTANHAQSPTSQPDGGGLWCYASTPTVMRSIFWGNRDGDLVAYDTTSCITVICCAIAPGGMGGQGRFEFIGESTFEDPRFCNPQPPGQFVADPLDFRLWADSPCLSWNSPCGERIGALGVGCPPAAIGNPEGTWELWPERARLVSVWPSPASDRLSCHLQLPRGGSVCVALYDLQGVLVQTVLDQPLPAGLHEFTCDLGESRSLYTGIYYLQMKAGPATDRRKVLLVR